MEVRKARAHISGRIKGGQSRPTLVEADDHSEYVIKFPIDIWPRALVNEAVCGTLAHLLVLPIPDLCLIEIPNSVAESIQLERGITTQPGMYFATRFIPNVLRINGYLANVVKPEDVINQEALSETMVYDYWLKNFDRKDDNVAMELLSSGADAGFRLWIIDNGLSLGGGQWTSASLVATASDAPAVQTPSILYQSSLDPDAMTALEERIRALDVGEIRPVCDQIPASWNLEADGCAAIEKFLNHRKPIVRSAIESFLGIVKVAEEIDDA